ncbi:c-type cytochrome [Flavobacterium adhaerens]|uniref:c-type cytochrome n=1 Tax=Flavobacterium adhaerens TaxID=3149043 RepID=UPI0032B3D0A7
MKTYILGIALIGLCFKGFSQDVNKGKSVYTKTCIACHQANGAGVPNAFPPLAKSDYLNANVNLSIQQVIKGSPGKLTVNGKKYKMAMPPQALTDQQIADVLTYVYASWGNAKKVITPAMVKAQRK